MLSSPAVSPAPLITDLTWDLTADAVGVFVMRTDEESGRLKRRQLMPSILVEQDWADCAGFNISRHSNNMRHVDVFSHWAGNVYLHDKSQEKIHMQLSKFAELEGQMRLVELR